jgi:hypothetical protein
MPFDLKRRKRGPQSARKVAQMKIALEKKIPRAEIDPVLKALIPFMDEDTTPEEVVDLATTAKTLYQNLQTALPLAEVLHKALEQVAEEGEIDPEDDPAEAKVRFVSALSVAMRDAVFGRGDPLAAPSIRPGAPTIRAGGHGHRAAATLPDQLADALYARITGRNATIGARYAGVSVPEIAELCLRAAGRSAGTGGWLSGRASQSVSMALHSTSDFPLALNNTLHRLVVEMYEAASSGVKQVSRMRLVTDFRAVSHLRASGSLDFKKIGEHGEFTYGTIEEAGETISVSTFGRAFGVSRQALVNDDVELLPNIARMLGEGAAQTEGKAFVELLNANSGNGPTMSDGQPLFHASHGNRAASGAALEVSTLSAARTAMRRQKDLTGSPINVTPSYLIVPPELETKAEQVLAEITAQQVSEVNPFTGKLTLVVDPYLTSATRWYVAAPAGKPEGLVHVYLDGESQPQIISEAGFDTDGMKFRGRLDFGCAFMDWRAWYMNPGA